MARLRTQVQRWAGDYHCQGHYMLRHGLGAWAELRFYQDRDYTMFYLSWTGAKYGFTYETVQDAGE